MKRKTMRFGILVLGLLIPGAFGQAETFTVDPGQSDVAFSLADVLHSVHGKLHVESGTVQFSHGPRSSAWNALGRTRVYGRRSCGG